MHADSKTRRDWPPSPLRLPIGRTKEPSGELCSIRFGFVIGAGSHDFEAIPFYARSLLLSRP